MNVPSGRLQLLTAAQRMMKFFADVLAHPDSYPLRRRIFNAQRMHQHPAMMSASRRRKLRST